MVDLIETHFLEETFFFPIFNYLNFIMLGFSFSKKDMCFFS
uniref:Uncharacterized protein n=1 Tax=Brugia timori TaxID=42155 RepID=A0A0R3RCY0_9BILA